jgi:hypothetical protein
MNTDKEVEKTAYESPQTHYVQVKTEGGFAASLEDSSTNSGSTGLQNWGYNNDTGDSGTWS